MILFLFNSYLVTIILQGLCLQKTPSIIPFEKIEVVFKNPVFQKHFHKGLSIVFLSLISFYIAVELNQLLYKLFMAYVAFNENRNRQLEDLGDLFQDVIRAQAEKLADEIIVFLKFNNLRDRLTRTQWIEFFKEILLGSSEAFRTFQELIIEMLKFAMKAAPTREAAINNYKKCLVDSSDSKSLMFPRLENDRFLRYLKKINKKYWSFSFYELQLHLETLLDLYRKSEFQSKQIRQAIECLRKELSKRVSTW